MFSINENSIYLALAAYGDKIFNGIAIATNGIFESLAYARDFLIGRIVGGVCQIINTLVKFVSIREFAIPR